MRGSRMLALAALITLVVGMAAVGDAVAGEKFKLRTVMYAVKWEQVDLADEEGHFVGLLEGKGIQTVIEGKGLCDGCVVRYGALVDINTETGLGSGHGHGEVTDNDGDKYYYRRRGKPVKIEEEAWSSYWEGELTIVKGTGKYEGIKGKGTWSAYVVAPMQWYYDEKIEVELP